MYKRIMVPVDLAHADRLERAIATAADLARHYGADLVLTGAVGTEPGRVARSPEDFAAKLAAFGETAAERHGLAVETDTVRVHDLAVDLDAALVREAARMGADLIVMGSHIPGAAEYIFGSNAGYVAQHARVSVMVVRGD